MAKKPNKNPNALTADDYSRRRVFGSEQEYGILVRCKNKGYWDGPDWCSHEECWDLKHEKVHNSFVKNGGRVYLDANHPEYASPEASNPLDAMIYDKAGERIVPREINRKKPRLFKNNTDGNGEFYGSHENYSMKRRDFKEFSGKIAPFLVSRIIFTGSGNINEYSEYEISQRARVTSCLLSQSTTDSRGIINTRDEPLGCGNGPMRLHIISGDGNLSETACYLKYGTMGLVLDLLEDGRISPDIELFNPALDFKRISGDLGLKENYDTRGFDRMTALEIQRYYWRQAKDAYQRRDRMTDDILNRWDSVLSGLAEDPRELGRQVDWVIKKNLIDAYIKKSRKDLEDDAVRNIDLRYHELGEKGLFYVLQDAGLVDRILADEQIEHAAENPPRDTRAWIRGRVVQGKIPGAYIQGWDRIFIRGSNARGRHSFRKCINCIDECTQHGTNNEVWINDPLYEYSEIEHPVVIKDSGRESW